MYVGQEKEAQESKRISHFRCSFLFLVISFSEGLLRIKGATVRAAPRRLKGDSQKPSKADPLRPQIRNRNLSLTPNMSENSWELKVLSV